MLTIYPLKSKEQECSPVLVSRLIIKKKVVKPSSHICLSFQFKVYAKQLAIISCMRITMHLQKCYQLLSKLASIHIWSQDTIISSDGSGICNFEHLLRIRMGNRYENYMIRKRALQYSCNCLFTVSSSLTRQTHSQGKCYNVSVRQS